MSSNKHCSHAIRDNPVQIGTVFRAYENNERNQNGKRVVQDIPFFESS
jgi:hypothetical protein